MFVNPQSMTLKTCLGIFLSPQFLYVQFYTYTILPKVLDHPLVMNRFDYFSNFYEYKS